MVSDDKKELRRHFLAQRKALTPEARLAADRAIVSHLRALSCYREASAVAFYMSDGTEPALDALPELDPGKRFFLPRFCSGKACYEMVEVKDLKNDLEKGRYGLWEPRAGLSAADPRTAGADLLYLVPAVACDETGTRLGRGGGYYDRLLADAKMPAVAVIYQCQSASNLPREAFDRPVGWVVSETAVRQIINPKSK